jgi:mannose-6-phosphate isomerase-like protein (cupin superfamily)
MADTPLPPLLPGAVGLTHLKVYDSVAPDGLPGGSPHLHLACTEAYYVTAGQGEVQTLSAEGFRTLPLEPGAVVWFSPGVIHRLVNRGGLEIFVVMQNAGLPEAGDFVLTFPPDVLADPTRYFEAASQAASGAVFTRTDESARRRRDLAVEGFAHWHARFDVEGPSALDDLYRMAASLIQPKVGSWRTVWENGPATATSQTDQQLTALGAGNALHLREGRVASLPVPGPDRRLGMCGTLGLYLPEGITKE